MWPEIWHVNPQIANPHLIFPGDTIKLIYLEGQPRLTAVRGEAGMAYRADSDSLTQNGASTSSNAVSGDQTLHPSIRVLPLEEPIPAIPLDIINPFLSGNRVVNPGLMEASPYVVQGSQSHVITGAGSELYTRGKLDPKTSVYGIFRQGKVYTDPVTKEVLGVQAIDVGTGKVKTQENDIARVDVVRSTQEVRPGDRLLINQERRVESTFFPSAPDTDVKGNIIDVEGGVTQVGAMSVVAINRGERDQLQSGNVLAIFQRGETLKDPLTGENLKLMDERAGLMMVFVTFEKMSYALVLYADRPLHVGDNFSKP
jgi:nucleoid-associated protein YgaU